MSDLATTTTMLEEVETAIRAIVTGRLAEFASEGESYQNLSLRELHVWRKQLRREIAGFTAGGSVLHADFDGPGRGA